MGMSIGLIALLAVYYIITGLAKGSWQAFSGGCLMAIFVLGMLVLIAIMVIGSAGMY